MISEANHYTTFIKFARQLGDPEKVNQRWEEWLEYEAKIIQSYGKRNHPRLINGKRGINYYIGLCFRSLLQGLVILGYIGATIGLIWYLVSSIDNIIPSISERFPGLVFISVIVITALVGFIGTKFLLGILVDAMDNLLEHTPGIKYIYSSLKDVMSSFVGDKRNSVIRYG